MSSPEGRSLAEAMLRANPQAQLVDRGAYLRVTAPARCALSRAVAEEGLGRPFDLRTDLEPLMPAFEGRIRWGQGEVVWEAT